jgi:hypothetical protein
MSEGMEDENNQTQHSSSEEQYPIAKTILPFSAKTLKELSLDVEDRVAIFWNNDGKADYWNGKNLRTGEIGWFPANVVVMMPDMFSPTKKTDDVAEEDEDGNPNLSEVVNEFTPDVQKPIKLSIGDRVSVKSKSLGWWYGKNVTENTVGWFPSKCLKEQTSTSRKGKGSSLTPSQEKDLVNWIVGLEDPPTPFQVRTKATEMARENYPNKSVFSSAWLGLFKQRHPEITTRIAAKQPDSVTKSKTLNSNEEAEIVQFVKDKNAQGEYPTRRQVTEKANEIFSRKRGSDCDLGSKWIIYFQRRNPSLQLTVKSTEQYFTEEEEQEIVNWILDKNNKKDPISQADIREFALTIAKRKHPNKTSIGKDWYNGFSIRHPQISLSKKRNRTSKAKTPEEEEEANNRVDNSQDDNISSAIQLPSSEEPPQKKQK